MKKHFSLRLPVAIALFAGIPLLFTGCASTSITSSTDPDYTGKSFHKIAVFADTADLELRAKVENTFVQNCGDVKVNAVSWLQIFPETRQHSDSSDDAALRANDVDAFLVFAFNGKGAQIHVDRPYYDKQGYHPEVVHKNPWVKFDATLYDVAAPPSWRKAWIAASTSQLNGTSDLSDPFITLINSLSQKVLDDLAAKGLIKKGS
jgi:hypothetical protein